LLATQTSKDGGACLERFWFGRFQDFTSPLSQPHHVCPRILPTAAALQQALSNHTPDHLGNRGPIDTCALNDLGLGGVVAAGDTQQDGELPRCQTGLPSLLGEDFIGALRHAMQEVDDNIVNRRSIPFALLHGHLQVELRFALLM